MKKLFTLLALAVPTLAMAHPGHDVNGLWAGVWHPIGGWDHLLAMVAVGLWAAGFHGKARWLIPASFVAVMSIGFVLGTRSGVMPMMEQGIAASVLVLGLAVAWVRQIPMTAAMTLVGFFALFHGVAHGAELGEHGAISFAIGFILSTALLHAAGLGIGFILHKNPWLVRLCGSLIGLVGLGMMVA